MLSLFLYGCGNSEQAPVSTTYNTPEMKTNMQLKPEKGDTIATIKTNMGEMKVLLYTEEAPETTKNFIELSKAGKYNDTIFHRVIANFMIQGGDFTNRNGTGGHSYKGPGTYLQDEFDDNLTHVKGALSMANAGPNTGGSQFFVVQSEAGTPWLNGKHAIFGYVYEGLDVVDKIADLDTDAMDRPLEDVVIEEVAISQQ